jgi:diguanylate cyclase (GGDEF)-like protein
VTLRTRLTTAFLAVVLGPVLLSAVFVGATVHAVSQDRAEHELAVAANATRGAVGSLCQQLATAAEVVTRQPPERRDGVAATLVGPELVAAIRIVDPAGGEVLLTEGAPPLPWADCRQPPSPTPVTYQAIAARATLPDRAGQVWAAARLDQALVERLAGAGGAAVTLVDRAGAGLSTGESPQALVEAARTLGPDQVGQTADGHRVRRLDPTGNQPLRLVLSVPGAELGGLYGLLTGVVVLAGGLAVAAAWRLARSTTRPLGELAQAADRVAEGDLTVRVPVRAGDEAGRLAATFNRMAHRTQSYVRALTASRDQLRRHLAVLGDTLSSTHDLDRILRVTLLTALTATSARAGSVLLLDPGSGALVGHTMVRHPDAAPGGEAEGTPLPDHEEPVTVPLGDGLLGSVATTGQASRGRVTTDGPTLHPQEPRCRTYVVVPITAPLGVASQAAPWPPPPTVRGVLALYDRLGADEFDAADLATLRTFASQAGVAVDNVRTHEEAQRLSLTDPLTGLWNYRSLKESLRREVERASRFHHRLAVLTLDLDRFKNINDGYGHPAGDAVLAEFARRLRSEVREVDLAFRQGGEEFVVVLPETDARGATVLAQRLGAAVRDEPMLIVPRGAAAAAPSGGQLPVRVTTSIGIAVYPDHAQTPSALLDAADDALYAAKAAGRDTYRVATPGSVPVVAAELPVRGGARIPTDNLPFAGRAPAGGPAGGSAASGAPAGGAPAGGAGRGSGGAQPPRQTRGR